ncbi:hypothetical protein F5141DRAFT_1157040 [Pisolithus sp. B1]|nr:hypothetical protein F5141DRAFT_1157040 [Pisolithus sp. B1]
MSTSGPDIPLHIIAPVSSSNRGHHQDTHPEPTERRMHSNVLRAAAARSAGKSLVKGRNKGKGKMREQYPDESDEEATLLGNVERHGEGDMDREDVEESTQMRRLQVSRHSATLSKSRSRQDKSRTIPFRPGDFKPISHLMVRNQKYNLFTFFPFVLYEQFKFFFNLYFLLVALSQFIPALKIGFIFTYVAPLAFVLCVTMGKEAYDDYKRHLRDREANSQKYLILVPPLSHNPDSGPHPLCSFNQRVPADMVLLRTSDPSGTCFIRTDQLDGETDWKLRVAVPTTQKLGSDKTDAPIKDLHTFIGTLTFFASTGTCSSNATVEPLTAENVVWSNTVLAAGSAVGFVVYTGSETRAVMNTSHPETKVGLLDLEINRLAKILCAVTFALSVVLVALNGFRGLWYIYVFRFLILFSSIIPISLRVNLDMGKTVYANQIMTDPDIPNTIVRTSTLPEELGRIEYLLSDKTGTLTQNEMEMKKLHMGTMSYGFDSMDEVAHQLATAFGAEHARQPSIATGTQLATRGRRDMSSRLRDVVLSLALCHNVTPVTNDDGSLTYQASSPDEVAIVKWTESVGLTLVFRDRTRMERMGIVVREAQSGELLFLQKGADVVMARIVQRNDWLEEETGNMARRRTKDARNGSRGWGVSERDWSCWDLLGVEDKLQDEVKSTLETTEECWDQIWMLTGDKIETARCMLISTKTVKTSDQVRDQLEFLQSKLDCCLVIDGESLQLCLNSYKNEFIEIATKLSAVVACRCSPTQKADVARLIRQYTKKRVCSADVGVGIVGKEGKQASLAADFSVTQFSYLAKLLMWHGRNSYRRSAKLAQFVIHRGLIISVMQAVFSAIFYFAPIALYQGWLMMGYATVYTMAPVFSLVLDQDVNEDIALIYPELYKELTKGRSLSFKTFFQWLMISVYQGGAIMIMSLVLFENEFLNIVAISFTALILNELIMVGIEITTWHTYMVIAEVVTLLLYVISIAFLPEYFDLEFVISTRFAWKVAVIVAVSALPLYLVKAIRSRIAPAAYSKLL